MKKTVGKNRRKNSYSKKNHAETQEKIFAFIAEYIDKHGFSPSIRDISAHTGIKSTSTVYNHLKLLNEKGRILYEKGKRRSISLPRSASDYVNHGQLGDERSLPLVGTAAAGKPIFADEYISDHIPFPSYLFHEGDEMFVLKIKGDSMTDAGILNGDYVLVRKQSGADYGKIVVALIGDEATVKRLILLDGKTYLKPENENYDLIPFYGPGCRILGQVTQVFRSHV